MPENVNQVIRVANKDSREVDYLVVASGFAIDVLTMSTAER